MASPPFEVEDTDEDFFDKLVEDDFCVSEASPSYVDGDDSDEVKAFSNLSTSEVVSAPDDFNREVGDSTKEENHSEDLIISSADAPGKENLVLEGRAPLVSSNLFAFDSVVESNDAGTSAGTDISLDSSMDTSTGSKTTSVKEVGDSTKEENHSKDLILSLADAPGKENLVSEGSAPLVSSNSFVFDSVVESNNAGTSAGADISLDSSMDASSGSKTTSVKEVQWSALYAGSDQNGGTVFGSYSDLFTELGDSSVDPFSEVGDIPKADSYTASGITNNEVLDTTTSFSPTSHQDMAAHAAATEQTNGQDSCSSQYWESLYPGWKYDPNSGEWQQVEGYEATENTLGAYDNTMQATINDVSIPKSEFSYLQQTTQSVTDTMTEACTTGSIASWNQVPQGSIEYPAHMVFDPQYPGWYYDTITQEWRLLESYTPVVQSINTTPNLNVQDENVSVGGFLSMKDHNLYNEYGQVETSGTQGFGGFRSNTNMWQPSTIPESNSVSDFIENHNSENPYGSRGLVRNSFDQKIGFQPMEVTSYELKSQSYSVNKGVTEFQSFVPTDNFSQHLNQPKAEQNQQMPFSHDYNGSQNSGIHSHQSFQTVTQSSHTPIEGRSPDGRPPHALVTFGFGGKLIVVKSNASSAGNIMYEGKDCVGGSVSVHDLMDVVMNNNDARNSGFDPCNYFRPLCHQSFPGPLVGGNVGNKELFKWIDERITNCGSPSMNYRNGELLRLLLSLLKIACQHYGKLRSPFGTGMSLKENDCPESALAKLFASAEKSDDQLTGYATHTHCLKNIPSEGQIRATATEVQDLLVSGRANEALQCAQGGQLWGPALILAAQLGDQFYADTVKQMAHCQLVAGSPLRTLCLLIAGQPADVFSADPTVNSSLAGDLYISQQQAQIGANVMLDDWKENLAIITANRTKGDELVILHLGDCLWKERGEITAAHICYLVAEANFESFSDSARLCLIGSDHWRFPRTYASPEAIQRTELYEYSTVLGNSQSILLPFQPYKLIYAHMLAEVGKLSESLKYCNTILKSLKTGRAPEVDLWKQLVSSLEERIRTHQQGGFGTNLAPGKLVGKIIGSIDRSIHRMIGPPPAPMMSAENNEFDNQSMGQKVAGSQSTMAMSTLMPSASMEGVSEWTGENANKRSVPNRSVSEPDFGRSPSQGSSKDTASPDTHSKTLVAGGLPRFGRIGSQLFEKTMGWVSKSRQAKLGEKNKFYYCEKRKQWVEEGAEPPAEEMSLPPPPPKTTTLQNGMPDYNIKNAFRTGENLAGNGVNETRSLTSIERSSGIPPIPPSSNQFSSRGRMGVRSRYVDTFNKGSAPSANSFQPPSEPVAKPPVAKPGRPPNINFFIPAPIPSEEQTLPAMEENLEETTKEDLSTVMTKDTLFSSQLTPSSSSIPRYESMSNISPSEVNRIGVQDNGNEISETCRTASWSGGLNDAVAPPKLMTLMKPLEEVSETQSSSSVPNDFSSSMHLPKSSSFGEDLQEVEL